MTLSRRVFVRTLGAGGLGALAIAARGREALIGADEPPGTEAQRRSAMSGMLLAVPPSPIRLDSNENPHGPGEVALEGIRGALGEASRYPDLPEEALVQAVARAHKVGAENILAGCGSTEILRMAVHRFTSRELPLVTAVPSFEDPARFARRLGTPVTAVELDASLRLDLRQMASAAAGAGLVYLCNPNNPTATAHGAQAVKDFVATVSRTSPKTTVLIDEAYYEYVDDPACATAVPLAMQSPRVIVSRTFSKIFGLAGLRVGYAVGGAETLQALSEQKLPSGVNLLGASAASAALGAAEHIEEQRRLNRQAKEFTRRFFESAGHKVTPSETNFMMVDLRRDAKEFRERCRARNVLIGRVFPPLNSRARISMGTMEEMVQAVEVFRQVLAER